MKLKIKNYKLTLCGSDVAQVAKPARSQKSAAPTGRFGNLRYVGPRDIN
jgi:hypothetical protein